MSYSKPTPLPPEDDLDRLLARELPKLLPQPFPAFQPPMTLKSPRQSWTASRMTLALSVAALLGLGLILSSAWTPPPRPSPTASGQLFDQSTADGQELLKRLHLEPAQPAPPPLE